MNSFALTCGIVLPMFLLLLCGWGLRRAKLIQPYGFAQMNQLCFYLLLPSSLLNNLIQAKDFDMLDAAFLLWILAVQIVILVVLFLVVPRAVPRRQSCASVIQAAFRSNFLMFGLAIAGAMCEREELILVSITAGILIPLYNIGGILILQHYCGGRTDAKKLAATLIKNPFVLACILGIGISTCKISLPEVVRSCISNLANAATTVSFLALGGSIELGKLREAGKDVLIGTLLRLVLLPALIIGMSVALGFTGIRLLSIVVMMISPTAVATFPLAERMGADQVLAGYLVVAQSVCSVATIFLWIWGLTACGVL